MSALTLLLAVDGSALAQEPATETDELRAQTEELRAELERMRAELAELRRSEGVRGSIEDDDGSRTGFGHAVVVAEGETVDEAVSFGSDVSVAGHVRGDAVSFGGNVRIAPTGRVDGDAVSFGGRVEVLDGGAVTGDRVAMGLPAIAAAVPAAPTPPSRPIGAGTVLDATAAGGDLLGALHRKLVWLLSLSGAGVLVVGLFPQRVGRVARDLEERPIRAAVVGTLGASFLLLFSLLFTLLTLGLGLPVSALLVALLGGAWLLGFVGLCQAVGDRLPFDDRPYGRWIAFLVGVVLLTFLGSLPWVGWLVVGAASILGVGSALSTRFGRA
jgi:hypothetical protein